MVRNPAVCNERLVHDHDMIICRLAVAKIMQYCINERINEMKVNVTECNAVAIPANSLRFSLKRVKCLLDTRWSSRVQALGACSVGFV